MHIFTHAHAGERPEVLGTLLGPDMCTCMAHICMRRSNGLCAHQGGESGETGVCKLLSISISITPMGKGGNQREHIKPRLQLPR